MEFPIFTSVHLVKGEDLNHHGTLYAGRTAEWFVESGFNTFIHVDLDGKPLAHGLDFVPATPEDKALNDEAKLLK